MPQPVLDGLPSLPFVASVAVPPPTGFGGDVRCVSRARAIRALSPTGAGSIRRSVVQVRAQNRTP